MQRAMNRFTALVAALATVGAMAGYVVAVAAPAGATTTTVIVGSGDFAAPHATDAQHAWAPEDNDANTGTYGIATGPGGVGSLGNGSLAMGIASGQHEWIVTEGYGGCAGIAFQEPCGGGGTLLSSISAMTYSTFRASGTTMPDMNIEVTPPGDGTGFTTFVYVPDATQYADNTWQTWDPFGDTTARWYSTHNIPGGGVFNCTPQTPACTKTWSQIVGSYGSARIVNGIGPNIGTGGTFSGNVDDFELGIGGNTTVFDFEPQCTTVCYVNASSGRDNATGLAADPFKTITEGVNAVSATGTVNVAAGTYHENVTVTKALTLAGAGQANTIIEPALSAPNPSGCGSLCPGASSVVLVQASNVTIHDLTVEGDNPNLNTGFSAGGANIDARNGIITNHPMGTFNNLSVHDTTIRDIYLRGLYASSGGTFTFTNNTVSNVQADAASIGIFNFGGSGTMSGNHVSATNDALSANHSRGTAFTNNVVTTSASGVHSDNSGDGGGTPDTISGNQVSCSPGGYGVWAFVPYLPFAISGNTVSGCAVGLAQFGSCDLGGSCPGAVIPTITFDHNTVNGAAGDTGFYVTTDTLGFGDADTKVSADHNVINGNDDGVYVEETGTSHVTAAINRNDLSGNTNSGITNGGSTVVDGTCNWWGAASGPSGVGPGAGSAVSSNVTFAPWLTSSDLGSTCAASASIAADAAFAEGNAGDYIHYVPVTLSSPQPNNVTVQYTTTRGTAASNGDYNKAKGTLTIPAGDTTGLIAVTIHGDSTPEKNESFTVDLLSSTGVALGDSSTTITLLNDDLKATMKNVGGTEGGSIPFTFTLKFPMATATTVQFCTLANDGASTTQTPVADYTFTDCANGFVTTTIPSQSLTASVAVQTNLDGIKEVGEKFQMRAVVPSTLLLVANGTIKGNKT